MVFPKIPTPRLPAETPDYKAKKEFHLLEKDRDLDQERKEGDHDRNELTKHWLAWVIRAMIVVAGIALIGGIGIWAWHLLTPWRWLTPVEISDLQKLVTSALLGMVASEYARRLFR